MNIKQTFFSALAALAVAPAAHSAPVSWIAGTAGDASGTWNGVGPTFNGQTYGALDDLSIDGTATKTITLSGAILNPNSLTVSSAGATTLTGASVGGTLLKSGSGDLTLASATTFGAVTINNGKFILTNGAGLGTTGTVTVAAGAATKASFTGTSYSASIASQFFLDTVTQTTDLNIQKNFDFGSPAASSAYAMVMKSGSSLTNTLSGNLTGSANANLWLDVNVTATPNPATWKLTGDNSGFAGSIRLNRGNLSLGSVASAGTGLLYIQSNSDVTNGNLTFDFGGNVTATLANAVTIRAGSTGGIHTGNSINTLNNDVTIAGVFDQNAGQTWFKIGSGKLTLTNAGNTFGDSGTTNISAGTLSIGGSSRLNGVTAGTYAGAMSIASGATFDYASTAAQTVSGIVSGAGRITKSGASTLTLSGANTFSGGITVTQGTVAATTAAALGTGAITASSSYGASYASAGTPFLSLTGTGAINVANDIVVATPASSSFYAIQKSGAGSSLTLSGVISGGNANTTLQLDTPTSGDSTTSYTISGTSNTLAGTLRLNRGTLTLGNANAAGTATIFLQTNANTAGNLIFSSAMTVANPVTIGTTANQAISSVNGDVVLSGAVTTSSANTTGGLNKVGAGTLSLTNASNALTGPTAITAGTLSISGGGRLNAANYAGNVAISSGATFEYASSADQVMSGAISGAGALAKSGASTLSLTGISTYTGGTLISGGTLQLGAPNRLADGGAVTLNGGTFDTGGFNETAGPLALGIGTTSIINFGAGASVLNFSSASQATWAGSLDIYNWTGNATTAGGIDQLIFASFDLTPAQLANVNFYSGSGSGKIGSGATFIGSELVPVPEPGAIALLALLLPIAGRRERRHSQKND